MRSRSICCSRFLKSTSCTLISSSRRTIHSLVAGAAFSLADAAWFSILDSEWPAVRAALDARLDPANFDAAGRQRHRLRASREVRGS